MGGSSSPRTGNGACAPAAHDKEAESMTKDTMSGTLAIKNAQPSAMRLRLELWGDQFLINPGANLQIAFSGPIGGRIEIHSETDGLVVYGWEGSVLNVQSEGT